MVSSHFQLEWIFWLDSATSSLFPSGRLHQMLKLWFSLAVAEDEVFIFSPIQLGICLIFNY